MRWSVAARVFRGWERKGMGGETSADVVYRGGPQCALMTWSSHPSLRGAGGQRVPLHREPAHPLKTTKIMCVVI
jgi:hypothetical protein